MNSKRSRSDEWHDHRRRESHDDEDELIKLPEIDVKSLESRFSERYTVQDDSRTRTPPPPPVMDNDYEFLDPPGQSNDEPEEQNSPSSSDESSSAAVNNEEELAAINSINDNKE